MQKCKKGKFLYSTVSSPQDLRYYWSTLHITSMADLFTQTPSRLLWEASTYPPLSITRYSFIQLSELEQCRVKKLAQGFNTVAQN